MITKVLALAITSVAMLSVMISLEDEIVLADRNDKPHKGNNGQCRKLQSSLPDELQDYEGCHDTFTGKNHDEPDEPLP